MPDSRDTTMRPRGTPVIRAVSLVLAHVPSLVRLGSKILLLGSSPAGLRTLAEVTDPVDVDFLAGVCRQNDADGTAAQTFRALFNRNLPERPAQRLLAAEGMQATL